MLTSGFVLTSETLAQVSSGLDFLGSLHFNSDSVFLAMGRTCKCEARFGKQRASTFLAEDLISKLSPFFEAAASVCLLSGECMQ